MTFARRYIAPILALSIGLAATLIAALLIARAEAGRAEARFEGLADGAVAAIESRMLAQLTLLRGAAGYFQASDRVSQEDFRLYVARLGLEANYPGVLGIGYAAYAPSRTELARIAAEGLGAEASPIRLWPSGERDGYSAILFLEPLNRLNQEAVGFDMMSEAIRRAAMEGAHRAGHARMSGKVSLVQEIDPVKQPGFLIYVPLSGEPSARGATDDRPGIRGWVYSPLRAHDLFGAIFSRHDLSDVVVEVFDEHVTQQRLLYRSRAPQASPSEITQRRIEIAGRPWVIRLSSTEHFEREGPFLLGAVVAGAGTLISLLIAALMFQQARSAARTEREVLTRTAELQEANSRLRSEAAAREAAEAQVRQMQKMEAVGQLTGGIAHDFNNMLAVIVGNLEMAERRIDEPERLLRALANARQGADKAAELTQRLLAFGRRQPLSPRVVDANRLVTGMSELLRRALGETVKLKNTLSDGLWHIHADPAQLENAIVNLAINARDAMPDGGTLAIETANCHLDAAYAREHGDGFAPGDYAMIAVRDTGSGMTEDVAARALEPFFTTKGVGRGTGLGLSQVYGFVKQSGGHLKIASEPGRGTMIRIYLPRYEGTETVAKEADAPPEPALPRARETETILIAEDEPRVREMSADALRELGYRVVCAGHGIEALAVLASEPEVALLFTDVVMPEMDGRRLAEEALMRRPDLKILFTTGYAPEAIMPHGGKSPLLQKPYSAQQLARKVREVLDRD